MFKLSIKDIIEFYDTSDKDTGNDNGRHATSLTSLIGEELSAGLLKHFFDHSGEHNSANLLNGPVTTGSNAGKRLDRWIQVNYNGEQILYQTEFKNWSAHSIGGMGLVMDASQEQTIHVAKTMFRNQFDEERGSLRYPTTEKVLTPMKRAANDPLSHYRRRPLICFWFPILPSTMDDPSVFFTRIPVSNQHFPELDMFSLSLYLRAIYNKGAGPTHLVLDLPDLKKRLGIIERLFSAHEL